MWQQPTGIGQLPTPVVQPMLISPASYMQPLSIPSGHVVPQQPTGIGQLLTPIVQPAFVSPASYAQPLSVPSRSLIVPAAYRQAYTAPEDGTHVFTPVDSTYALVFDEEFNGTTVDTTKWHVLNQSGNFNGVNASSANATVSGGVLTLTLSNSTTGAFISSNQGPGSTPFFMDLTNGPFYAEARIKCPAQPAVGLWPAWWANANGSMPEIDFQEWLGRLPTHVNATYFNANGTEPHHQAYDTGVDQALAYHIVGCLISTSSMTWYYDGVQISQCINGQTGFSSESAGGGTVNISTGPYCLNIQIGGGSGYGGAFNGSTAFPAHFLVDYVHVYQVGGTPVTPQTNYDGPGSTAGPT